MTNQTMSNLYHDLFTHGPKASVLKLLPELGTGTISQVITKQNVVFSDWDMVYRKDMNAEGFSDRKYLQIIFCLEEGIFWDIRDQSEGKTLIKGESWIYPGQGKMESICYGSGKHFHFKSIKMPVEYFDWVLRSFFAESEIQAYREKIFSGISKVMITPYMEHIFAELQEFTRFRGSLSYLFLESKLFELLCVYLSGLLELDILTSPAFRLPRNDWDIVEEARKIIDSELAFAPSCEELARRMGVSVSKLIRGFSTMYGMSVHAYVIDQRLCRAADMLLESNLNIGQICTLIGYRKASNFSAAFRKKYGVLPKDYRRGHIVRRKSD